MGTTSHHRILIVDDDDDDRYIINYSFRQIEWEHHIKILDSGDSMFRHLGELPHAGALPTLILLDYNMPRMGAEEILSRLKRHEQYSPIKVVVYSTGMTDKLRSRLKDLGASDCYSKCADTASAVRLASLLRREAQPPVA